MTPTETPPTETTESTATTLSPRARTARRRVWLVMGGMASLLVLLWLGDSLSGLVPSTPFHPDARTNGPYTVTIDAPTNPQAGAPLAITAHVTATQGQPPAGAAVSYEWDMVTMDMGSSTGAAAQTGTPGAYALSVTAAMSGYWRLTLRIHANGLPDGSVDFDIPISG